MTNVISKSPHAKLSLETRILSRGVKQAVKPGKTAEQVSGQCHCSRPPSHRSHRLLAPFFALSASPPRGRHFCTGKLASSPLPPPRTACQFPVPNNPSSSSSSCQNSAKFPPQPLPPHAPPPAAAPPTPARPHNGNNGALVRGALVSSRCSDRIYRRACRRCAQSPMK